MAKRKTPFMKMKLRLTGRDNICILCQLSEDRINLINIKANYIGMKKRENK